MLLHCKLASYEIHIAIYIRIYNTPGTINWSDCCQTGKVLLLVNGRWWCIAMLAILLGDVIYNWWLVVFFFKYWLLLLLPISIVQVYLLVWRSVVNAQKLMIAVTFHAAVYIYEVQLLVQTETVVVPKAVWGHEYGSNDDHNFKTRINRFSA